MRVEGIPEPVLLLYIHHRICRRLKKKKIKKRKNPSHWLLTTTNI